MNDFIKEKMKLGPRLQTIASYVPPGSALGDIGTDHAYLPVYLAQEGIIAKAIGVDIHKGPYESAQQTVKSYGLQDRIHIRLGNGLAPLGKGEVNTLTIAGMGGVTILGILSSNPPVMEGVSTLILQPQGAEARVRGELISQGWKLQDECLVQEDGRVYHVICFSRLNGRSQEEIEKKVTELLGAIFKESIPNPEIICKIIWQLGPFILTKKEKLLIRILNDNLSHARKVILEMNKTGREDVRLQADNLKQEIKIMEGIRTWLLQ